MTDLVIINPTAHAQIYQGLSNGYAAFEPPIWAGMLSLAMKHQGFDVELVDCEGLSIGYEDAARLVKDCRPKLVCIPVYGQQPSASTQNMYGASLTCSAIKDLCPDIPVLLIGGHISALPEQTLLEERADFVCQGEGVHTLNGLLQSDMTRTDHLKKVPGLWFKDEFGLVQHTAQAPMIPMKEMELVLPGVDYDALPMDKYRAHNWHCYDGMTDRSGYASIYTSLGCPFSCSFCCINAPFGANKFRYWSPEFIVNKIDKLVEKHGIRNLKIADEMFVLRDDHFLEICKLLAQRDYKLNIWAYSRIDTIKDRHLEALKAAGVNWLGLGIESISKKVRDDVIKGRFSDDKITQVVKKIQGAGINVAGNFIFGLPEDDFDSMKLNLDYCMSLELDMANLYSAMAYPGSQLHRSALQDGIELPDSWLGYSQHSFECKPLSTNYIDSSQVLAFRDKAWQAFHTDPAYLARMEAKFGAEVGQHLREMTQYVLPRKNAAPTLQQEFSYPHFNSADYLIPNTK